MDGQCHPIMDGLNNCNIHPIVNDYFHPIVDGQCHPIVDGLDNYNIHPIVGGQCHPFSDVY